jgi:FAD/FMN-containing dehydrogenase
LHTLAVLFEGTPAEVDWQIKTLQDEWRTKRVSERNTAAVNGAAADWLLSALTEFPHAGLASASECPLAVKVAVRPSRVARLARQIVDADPEALVQCHAGNGVAVARFANFNDADLTRVLVSQLQADAAKEGGSVSVLRSTFLGLTPQIVWGGRQPSFELMESVKRQFDPGRILNPGRFIFA